MGEGANYATITRIKSLWNNNLRIPKPTRRVRFPSPAPLFLVLDFTQFPAVPIDQAVFMGGDQGSVRFGFCSGVHSLLSESLIE